MFIRWVNLTGCSSRLNIELGYKKAYFWMEFLKKSHIDPKFMRKHEFCLAKFSKMDFLYTNIFFLYQQKIKMFQSLIQLAK